MRVVIADAGPLIGLARIEQLNLLRDLFQQIWITDIVAGEVGLLSPGGNTDYPGRAVLLSAVAEGWLQIAPADESLGNQATAYQPVNPGVDHGEASAIALALQIKASGDSTLLLIDYRCGRAEARKQGLTILGTAAALVLAKEQGLISQCAPVQFSMPYGNRGTTSATAWSQPSWGKQKNCVDPQIPTTGNDDYWQRRRKRYRVALLW